MTAIWQQRDGDWRLLAPSGFPDEKTLHGQVEEAPQLLPLAGNPRLAILGREVRLGSGFADLVGVEESGRPVIIEVKLARNAEARRAVVAQVLAYAAYLYGATTSVFESEILGDHLTMRGFDSVASAVAEVDQVGRVDPSRFEEALGANLAAGRFRLVLVLDEAPPELVKLVGYLEAVTPELVIDLVTVSMYEVADRTILVPQRVDPESTASAATAPEAARLEGDGGKEGLHVLEEIADAASPEAVPQLRRVLEWADTLEAEGLTAWLGTYQGHTGITTLYPKLPVEGKSLVTFYVNDQGGYVRIYRSVFDRTAPDALATLERTLAPMSIGQGTAIHDLTEEVLAILLDAYREANKGTAS